MKKILIFSIILLLPFAYAQEEESDEAGSIGPEHGWLHAFDIVSDNIKAFLSRIGSEETHANAVRRIVAERRAEQRRLLTLMKNDEITPQEYASMVSELQKHIDKKEQEQRNAEQAAQQKREEAQQKREENARQASEKARGAR